MFSSVVEAWFSLVEIVCFNFQISNILELVPLGSVYRSIAFVISCLDQKNWLQIQ